MDYAVYGGLFLTAFAAATILPLQSEALLVALLSLRVHPAWLLIAVATTGNVLGSVLNWWLGRWIEHYRDRRWFPVSPERIEAAQRRYRCYGQWSLLLSWAPIIGDPLTVVAGLMREPLWRFLPLVLIAKLGRYLALVIVYEAWMVAR
jgi:membrane protein YqaA with SNARE-associated domain